MKEELKDFVRDFWSYKKDKIKIEKSLDDLGMYGDDKRDFLICFIHKFNIESSNLDYDKYCEKETFNPLRFLFSKKTDQEKPKITIKHLIEVAEKKVWFDPS